MFFDRLSGLQRSKVAGNCDEIVVAEASDNRLHQFGIIAVAHASAEVMQLACDVAW